MHDKIVSMVSGFMATWYILTVSKSLSSQEVFLELDVIFQAVDSTYGTSPCGVPQRVLM